MEFDLAKTLEVLERTPGVLKELLSGISNTWVMNNEGGDTWSPYDVIGHLIHGELTDWMGRIGIILGKEDDKKFKTFDRLAQFRESEGKSLQQLLEEFESLRKKNLETLRNLNLTADDLNKTGIHPAFGEVTLKQLLSTWTVHDLSHIAQVTRVMAKQYKEATGPWIQYLRVLQ